METTVMKPNIKPFDPCRDGLKYYESKASFEEAWNACARGDWMLWIADKLEIDDRTLTRAKALSANTVRLLMKDERSTAAVDAALRYADGKISREELDKYARDAQDAYRDAKASGAAYLNAADAAYWASYAAYYSADAAYWAAESAYYAAYAANYAAKVAARVANLRATANICREVLTEAVFEKIKKLNTFI